MAKKLKVGPTCKPNLSEVQQGPTYHPNYKSQISTQIEKHSKLLVLRVMLPASTHNLSRASMHVHVELEAAVLEGEEERVVDGNHPSIDGELTPAFGEDEPFTFPLHLNVWSRTTFPAR